MAKTRNVITDNDFGHGCMQKKNIRNRKSCKIKQKKGFVFVFLQDQAGKRPETEIFVRLSRKDQTQKELQDQVEKIRNRKNCKIKQKKKTRNRKNCKIRSERKSVRK